MNALAGLALALAFAASALAQPGEMRVLPSPHRNAELARLAAELDPIFARIAADATGS